MSLYRDRNRSSAGVKAIAERRVEEIDRKILELEALSDSLGCLVKRCHGAERPDCPILDDLAGEHIWHPRACCWQFPVRCDNIHL